MIYFADTSAIGKRYVWETGSIWMSQLAHPASGNLIVVSELAQLELISILARRHRDGSVDLRDFIKARNDYWIHTQQQYRVIYLDTQVIRLARSLILKYPLKTLDAIQLASAQIAQQVLRVALIFLSADQRLLNLANSEGFLTVNPNP